MRDDAQSGAFQPEPTPPWEVDAWDLAADFAKIEQQWGVVRGVLEDPDHFAVRHRRTSGWSCGEHAGHIVIVARGIAEGVERILGEPDRNREEEPAAAAAAVLASGRLPRGGMQAPERLDPTGRTREELGALGPIAQVAWASLSRRAEELHACPARFRHFALGYLTSADWVRFCAIHTAHHLAIVRDIEASEREA